MATRRRDIPPGKVKTLLSSPSQTTTTTVTRSHSLYHNPTPPQKHIPNYLRSTARSSAIDVSDQQIKKSTSNNTPAKPTNTVRRSFDKTPLPAPKTQVSTNPVSVRSSDKTPLRARKTQVSTNPISFRPSDKTPLRARKTQVSTNPISLRSSDKSPLPARKTNVHTNPSIRSSSISVKSNIAPRKLVPSKNLKALNEDVVEKRRSLYAIPVITTMKKSSTVYNKEQETEKGTISATKEQITNTFPDNVKIPNIYHVPEVEKQPEDQESCVNEGEEQIIQVVNNDEKGTVDLVLEDQEKPLDIKQIEAENDDGDDDDDKDAKLVTNESSPILEQQETPLVNKAKESENKALIEEKFEEHHVPVIDSNNTITEIVADNNIPKEEAEEKEVKEVEKEIVEKEKQEDKEKALNKKDEVASTNEVIVKPMEIKEQEEVVEEKKQESENVTQRQKIAKGKKDSVVSNDVIEETASKLRDQRKNRVKALAGAFETVISLQ